MRMQHLSAGLGLPAAIVSQSQAQAENAEPFFDPTGQSA